LYSPVKAWPVRRRIPVVKMGLGKLVRPTHNRMHPLLSSMRPLLYAHVASNDRPDISEHPRPKTFGYSSPSSAKIVGATS